MIKLENEQVAKEVTGKAINMAFVYVVKPSAELFKKSLKFAVGKPVKFVGRKAIHGIGQKIHPTEGKQSVKTLIRQGRGVTTIPLADEGMKDFQKIAKKYGVDFALVKDKSVSPPKYTLFFKAQDSDAITKILDDYAKSQVKDKGAKERPSVLEKLQKFKEKVAEIPKKVLEKKKVVER